MNNDSSCPKRIVCKSYRDDLDDAVIMLDSLVNNKLDENHRITFIVPGKDIKVFQERMPAYVNIVEEEILYNKNERDWFVQRNKEGLGWITQQVSKLKYGALRVNEVLYYIDSDSIIFRRNYRDIAKEELKVFTNDQQCTVDENGRLQKRIRSEENAFKYRIKKDAWQRIVKKINSAKVDKEKKICWKSKHELVSLFFEDYIYFNPMPLPVIRGKHIELLEQKIMIHGLSFIDIIEYSPHEYYWVFLNAASEGLSFNFDKPHAIHVKNKETLCRLWKNLLKGENMQETIHALVMAPKNIKLGLSVKRGLSKYLQELS